MKQCDRQRIDIPILTGRNDKESSLKEVQNLSGEILSEFQVQNAPLCLNALSASLPMWWPQFLGPMGWWCCPLSPGLESGPTETRGETDASGGHVPSALVVVWQPC